MQKDLQISKILRLSMKIYDVLVNILQFIIFGKITELLVIIIINKILFL